MIIVIDTESQTGVLARKWKYNPLRRIENIAGQEAMTEKQGLFLTSLFKRYPSEFKEIVHVINTVWGVGMDEWTKADAMFVINCLYKPGKQTVRKYSAVSIQKDDYGGHETDGGYTPPEEWQP